MCSEFNSAIVVLGTKKQCLYSKMSGKRINVIVYYYIKESGAYIVGDNRMLYIVTESMIHNPFFVLKNVQPIRIHWLPHFKYDIGKKVPFTFSPDVYDTDGNSMTGKVTSATVLYYIRIHAINWYVLRLARPHYDERDPDNWWTGYDIRKEEDVK